MQVAYTLCQCSVIVTADATYVFLFILSVSYFENLIIALIYWAPFWSGHFATCFTYLSFVVLMVALQTQVLFYPFQTLETKCCKQLPWPGLLSWPAAEAESKPKLASL